MLIKEILNEYELDAVESILENRQLNLEQLKGKRIVCLGSDCKDLTQAIICSFLMLNDKKKENITVYYVPMDGEAEEPSLLSSIIGEREDLIVIPKEKLSDLTALDFCIDVGYCNRMVTEETYTTRMATLTPVWDSLSHAGIRRYLLLSDYRSYDTVPVGVVAAENEYAASKHVIRRYEEYCIKQAVQHKVAYQILRSAIALGMSGFNSHPIHKLIAKYACKEEVQLTLNPAKYTLVYVSDLLGAILYTLTVPKENEVYNVTGKDATITSFELARVLSEVVINSSHLTLLHKQDSTMEPIAMDGAKLLLAGYEGQIPVIDGFEIALKAGRKEAPFFLFHDTYHGKLSAIHQLMLQVLMEIDTICKKHDIKYFLGGGTLLGAIRHQGFIPWDDDADIMMLREDYERFVAVAQKELPKYLQMQTAKTDKNNHFFSKVRIKDTICATEFTRKLSDINVGLFVDIFPHDYTANSRLGQKLHQNLTMLARSLVYNKWGATYIKGDGSHRVYRFMATILKTILPMGYLEWQQFAIIEFFKNKRNRRYLYDGMGQNLKKGPFPKEWLDERVYVPFEHVQLPVPKEYDKYLTHLYGDYMQMVGVSKRKNSHTIYLLDLGRFIETMDNNSMQE